MSIKKSVLFLLVFVLCSFLYSYFLLEYYVNGDQHHYHRYYIALSGVSPIESILLARSYLGNSEPLSPIILWFGAFLGLEKNIYISILNVFLLVGIYFLSLKSKTRWYVTLLFVTNFYTTVLLTGAERLKISYICLVYAAIFSGKIALFLALLSPLLHFQSVILLASIVLVRLWTGLRSGFCLTVYSIFSTALILLVIVMLLLLNIDGIISKTLGYMGKGGITELFNAAILLCLMLTVSNKSLTVFASFFVPSIAILFIGGDRVNMIVVTVSLWLLLIEKKIHHPFVLVLLIYFSLKSIPFITNIFHYGSGFIGDPEMNP